VLESYGHLFKINGSQLSCTNFRYEQLNNERRMGAGPGAPSCTILVPWPVVWGGGYGRERISRIDCANLGLTIQETTLAL
jgi:hypothetical protein